jgi:hypothetical protein
MKRLSLLFVATLLMVSVANAQFLRFGVKGGLNSSTMTIDKTTLENVSTLDGAKNFVLEQGDSEFGLHFGVFGRIQVAGVFIQPEVLFTQTKGNFVISDQADAQSAYNAIVEQKFNRLDIPVMAGYKFGPAKVFLGPVATFTLSEKDGLKDKMTDFVGENSTVENSLNNAVFGYQVGIGLDILKFATLDVKYEGNLSKLGDQLSVGGQNFNLDQRNPQWIFSLGIFF